MFDFSFYELLVFGVIALIVLGPEKLPQAVRTMGTYYAKFRRTVGTIKAEMEAELDLAETRQIMQEELAKIRQTEAKMKQEMDQLRDSMQEFEQQQTTQLKQTLHQDSNSDNPEPDSNLELKDNLYLNNAPEQDASAITAEKPSTHHQETPYQKASYQENDDWVHPVAGANPMTPTVPTSAVETATTNTNLIDNNTNNNGSDSGDDGHNSQDMTQINHKKDDESWQLPMTRPWENMWFLLSDYERVRRLPPAPFLPNHKANPLLNAMPHHNIGKDSTTNNNQVPTSTLSASVNTEVNS